MKSRWILLAATAALCSCGSRTAQTTAQTETAPESMAKTAETKAQISGGYSEQRPLLTNEEQLFDVLTLNDSVAYTAKSVATQVVAGMNYKYLCTAEPKSGGKPYLVELVIYLPLPSSDKKPQITHIERCE